MTPANPSVVEHPPDVREMGNLAGCGDCPGGVDVGGDWARWGEGQRCVGRGSEEGCGSSEWTGVRVLKGRRPVGRGCSLGWDSRRRIPIALWSEQGTTCLRIPRHCSEPEESPFGLGWKEFSRNSQGWRREEEAGPDRHQPSRCPAPARHLKEQEGRLKVDPLLQPGKRDVCSFLSLNPTERHWSFRYTFLKQS